MTDHVHAVDGLEAGRGRDGVVPRHADDLVPAPLLATRAHGPAALLLDVLALGALATLFVVCILLARRAAEHGKRVCLFLLGRVLSFLVFRHEVDHGALLHNVLKDGLHVPRLAPTVPEHICALLAHGMHHVHVAGEICSADGLARVGLDAHPVHARAHTGAGRHDFLDHDWQGLILHLLRLVRFF